MIVNDNTKTPANSQNGRQTVRQQYQHICAYGRRRYIITRANRNRMRKNEINEIKTETNRKESAWITVLRLALERFHSTIVNSIWMKRALTTPQPMRVADGSISRFTLRCTRRNQSIKIKIELSFYAGNFALGHKTRNTHKWKLRVSSHFVANHEHRTLHIMALERLAVHSTKWIRFLFGRVPIAN